MDDRAKARAASNDPHWYVLMIGVLLTCTQCGASAAATDAGVDVAAVDAGADVVARCPMTVVDGSGSQQTPRGRVRQGEAIVVARVTAAHTECSGAGGDHVLFAVARTQCGSPFQTVYMGGHAFQGPEYVAGVWVVLGVNRSMNRDPMPANPGWCLPEIPATDAIATGAILAANEADATRLAIELAQ